MSMIVHSEYEKLKDYLSNLIYEYEDLINHICPNIEMEYLLKFGIYEYELYKKELELNKLKFKLKLLQTEINHQNDIDLNEINKKVLDKYKEYEKNLKNSMNELENIIKHKDNYFELDEEDEKELKRIYKILIKKLHPDLNIHQEDFKKELFIKVTNAYKNGDLEELKALYAMLPDEDIEEKSSLNELKELIHSFEKKIEKIKSDYPYNKLDLLSNEKEINDYKINLQYLIDSCNEEIKDYGKSISSDMNYNVNQIKYEEIKDYGKKINEIIDNQH